MGWGGLSVWETPSDNLKISHILPIYDAGERYQEVSNQLYPRGRLSSGTNTRHELRHQAGAGLAVGRWGGEGDFVGCEEPDFKVSTHSRSRGDGVLHWLLHYRRHQYSHYTDSTVP